MKAISHARKRTVLQIWEHNRHVSSVSGVAMGGHCPKDAPAQAVGLRYQTATLIVGQPLPTVSKLLPQHAILLAPVVDRLPLALVHLAAKTRKQEAERVQ